MAAKKKHVEPSIQQIFILWIEKQKQTSSWGYRPHGHVKSCLSDCCCGSKLLFFFLYRLVGFKSSNSFHSRSFSGAQSGADCVSLFWVSYWVFSVLQTRFESKRFVSGRPLFSLFVFHSLRLQDGISLGNLFFNRFFFLF